MLKIVKHIKAWWAYKRDPHLAEIIYITNQHLVNEILNSLKDDADYIAFMEKYREQFRMALRKDLNRLYSHIK